MSNCEASNRRTDGLSWSVYAYFDTEAGRWVAQVRFVNRQGFRPGQMRTVEPHLDRLSENIETAVLKGIDGLRILPVLEVLRMSELPEDEALLVNNTTEPLPAQGVRNVPAEGGRA